MSDVAAEPVEPDVPDQSTRRARAVAAANRWRDTGVERGKDIESRFWPAALAHQFYDRFREVNAVVLAGHLAFRAFMFLLPLMFAFVAAAGVLHAIGRDPGETADDLRLGDAIVQSMRKAGTDAGESPVQVVWAAGLGLVLGALGLLSGLHRVYAQVWQVDPGRIEGKVGKLVRFVLAFSFVLGILALASSLRTRGFMIGVVSVMVTGALMAVLFVGLSMIMPHRSEGIVWLIPGGIVGALGVIGLQAFATYYLPSKVEKFSTTYGALGVSAVAISYLFLIGQIVVASALADAVWFDYRNEPSPAPGDDADS